MGDRNYAITSFKETFTITEHPAIKFAVWQLESCPDTNKRHYQGYIEFKRPIRISAVKLLLNDPGLHCEKRRGTREQAIAYCKKIESRVDGPWTVGQESITQGTRTDLATATKLLLDTKDIKRVAEELPTVFVRNYRGLSRLLQVTSTPRRCKPIVQVFWGPTGTGKTHQALQILGDKCYIKEPEHKWWDGYTGQKNVLIDDFKPNAGIPTQQLLRLLDKYPCKVEVKGDIVEFLGEYIIITSNFDPKDWLFTEDQHYGPLMRRLTNVEHMAETRDEVTEVILGTPSLGEIWCEENIPETPTGLKGKEEEEEPRVIELLDSSADENDFVSTEED